MTSNYHREHNTVINMYFILTITNFQVLILVDKDFSSSNYLLTLLKAVHTIHNLILK